MGKVNLKTAAQVQLEKESWEQERLERESRKQRLVGSRASLDRMTLPELRIVVRDILEHLGIHEEISKDSEVN